MTAIVSLVRNMDLYTQVCGTRGCTNHPWLAYLEAFLRSYVLKSIWYYLLLSRWQGMPDDENVTSSPVVPTPMFRSWAWCVNSCSLRVAMSSFLLPKQRNVRHIMFYLLLPYKRSRQNVTFIHKSGPNVVLDYVTAVANMYLHVRPHLLLPSDWINSIPELFTGFSPHWCLTVSS